MKHVSIETKFSLWTALAILAFGLVIYLSPALHAQSNIGQVKAAAINSEYYYNTAPYGLSIQSAVTAACANAGYGHKGEVVIPVGAPYASGPTTTTGCAGVGIIDKSAGFPWVCYKWTGSGPYAVTSCTGAGGGNTFSSIIVQNPGDPISTVITQSGIDTNGGDFEIDVPGATFSIGGGNFVFNATSNFFILDGLSGCLQADPSGHQVTGSGSPCGSGGTGVASFAAPAGSWPSFMVPTVTAPTTAPVLTVALASQSANAFFAAPNGSAGVPGFRAIVAADIPLLNQDTTGSAAKLLTAHLINGHAFDGTADITITAAPSGTAAGALAGTYPNPTIKNMTSANNIPLADGSGGLIASGLTADGSGNLNGAGAATFNSGFNMVDSINPLDGIFLQVNTCTATTNENGSAIEILTDDLNKSLSIGESSQCSTGVGSDGPRANFIRPNGASDLWIVNEATGGKIHVGFSGLTSDTATFNIASPTASSFALPRLLAVGSGSGILASLATSAEVGFATTAQQTIAINTVNCILASFCTVPAAAATLTGTTLPALNGAALTALNATQLTSGTVPAAQLPLATTGAFGAVKCDGTTISCSAGVIAVIGGGSGPAFQVNGAALTSATTINYQTGTGIVVTNPSAGNVAFNLSLPINGAGAGFVTGPSTTVNNRVVIYNGTTGQQADSGVAISNLATMNGVSSWQSAQSFQRSIISAGTTFTIASGCGTTTSLTGGAWGGSFVAGQIACIPVITLGGGVAVAHGWTCWANDITTPADIMKQSATTTTTATLTGTVVSGDVINFGCTAY